MLKAIKRVILCAPFLSAVSAHASNSQPAHWDAGLYKNNSVKLQYTTAMTVIDKLKINPGDVVLDVGCGEGKITKHVASRVPEGFVYGFDISEGMIDLAQRDFGELPNVEFTVGDASKFFYNVEFDKILSFFTLQWVKDKQSAFSCIYKNLKPGGEFSLVVTDRNAYLKGGREMLLAQDKWQSFFVDYEDPTNVIDDQAYETYLKKAGFTDFQIRTEDRYVYFDSFNELKKFVKMVTAHINKLPEELKDEFIDMLMEHYVRAIKEVEGTKNYIMYKVFYISGKK
ncbi:MAG: methyltransferase domain-containing protein [Alphaproteobacteria bacterium]|nr:methyltransferase domain-containing protein [Alphaproteobacteria bacterium]